MELVGERSPTLSTASTEDVFDVRTARSQPVLLRGGEVAP
jgi:hypothetical protein